MIDGSACESGTSAIEATLTTFSATEAADRETLKLEDPLIIVK